SARQTSIADHGRLSLLLVGPRRGDHRAYGRLIFRGVGISLLMEPLDGASIKDPSKANKHWSVLMIHRIIVVVCAAGLLSACGERSEAPTETQAQASQAAASTDLPFNVTEIAKFNEPWAMTFLPDGRLLVTEKKGALKLYTIGGAIEDISGVPEVAYQGQGGLGDVVLHPDFEENGWVYLSYAEAGDGDTRGAAVARAKLELDENGGGRLADLQVIWRQVPKVTGAGHYGHRIAFDKDNYLWITSGERQKFDPAQDMESNLGKIVRLHDDGSVPK